MVEVTLQFLGPGLTRFVASTSLLETLSMGILSFHVKSPSTLRPPYCEEAQTSQVEKLYQERIAQPVVVPSPSYLTHPSRSSRSQSRHGPSLLHLVQMSDPQLCKI